MSRYRVGDKVRVKTNLEVDEDYGGLNFVYDMEQYLGKEMTICKIDYEGDYKLAEDDNEWYWNDEMLEDIPKKPKRIKVTFDGLKTTATLGGKYGIAKCNPNEVETYDRNEGIRIAVCRVLGIDPFKVDENIIVKELKDYTAKDLLEELAKRLG